MQSFQARSLIQQILKFVGYAMINQSQNLLRISLVSMKRSITQMLPLTVLKINGKCQHQSTSIPVDCIDQPPWWIKMHTCVWQALNTCIQQAHKVSHLLAYPSLLSVLIWVQDWLLGSIRAPLGARAYPWILSKYCPCVRLSVHPSVCLSPYRLA